MKFYIEYCDIKKQQLLSFDPDEYSFDIEPSVNEINFDIEVNKLKPYVSR